jgi:hypothetical protein
MRIAFLVGECVVFPVNGHPLFRRQAGREPQGEAEKPCDKRVKRERSVGCGAMQIDRRAKHGDLYQHDGDTQTENQPGRHASTSMNEPITKGYQGETARRQCDANTRRSAGESRLPASALKFLHEID